MAGSRSVVRRYYAYLATTAYGLYLPVGLLYLEQQYGYAVVGLTQGVFAFALVAAEIPTGYVGDRIGRRASLALGNVISAGALASFVFLDSPLEYCVLYVVWAFGWAFHSGTGEAWLYELLSSHGEDDRYTHVSSRGASILLAASAIGALLAGGLVPLFGWGMPLFANAALFALGIPIVLSLPKSGSEETDGSAADGSANAVDDDVFGVRDAVRLLHAQTARPEVRWAVAYLALFHVLFAVTRPYESIVANNEGVSILAIGAMYAGFKLFSAGAASTAGWIRDVLGTRGVFVLLIPVYGLAYATLAFAPVLVFSVFFLNRGLKQVMRPVRNQYLNDRLENVGRATVLSGVSMALSIASGTATTFSGVLIGTYGPFQFFATAGVLVAGVAGVLWVAVDPIRDPAESGSADAPTAAGTD